MAVQGFCLLGNRTKEIKCLLQLLFCLLAFQQKTDGRFIQMQTRMVAERSRRLNRVCVEGAGTKCSEKRDEGKSERGMYIEKHRLTCFSGFWILNKNSSFFRNVFMFPNPLVSAEHCVFYHILHPCFRSGGKKADG